MSELSIKVEGGTSVRLLTKGKYCDKNIVVTAEGGAIGELTFTLDNGTHIDLSSVKRIVIPEGEVVSIARGTEILWQKGFTVRFYNGTTLLQTVENVPHGGTATYTGSEPTKEGEYAFTGFQPDGTNITADTDCYAQFKSTAVVYTKLIDRSISGEYVNDRVESVGTYAFGECHNLITVNLPSAKSVAKSAFYSCIKLTTVNLPLTTTIGGYAFQSCIKLTTADFPLVTSIESGAFEGCRAITTADFPLVTSIAKTAFVRCSALTALILRSGTMCTLSHSNALDGTAIASGTGYIYVPRALIDTYKAATNWSTYAAQFRAIEDYPEITGGEA